MDEHRAFSSQEICEQTTGKECTLSMCDLIPAGKTVQEVCGDKPGKGYYPISKVVH